MNTDYSSERLGDGKRIRRMYESGISMGRIANEIGWSKTTCYKLMDEYSRKVGDPRVRKARYLEQDSGWIQKRGVFYEKSGNDVMVENLRRLTGLKENEKIPDKLFDSARVYVSNCVGSEYSENPKKVRELFSKENELGKAFSYIQRNKPIVSEQFATSALSYLGRGKSAEEFLTDKINKKNIVNEIGRSGYHTILEEIRGEEQTTSIKDRLRGFASQVWGGLKPVLQYATATAVILASMIPTSLGDSTTSGDLEMRLAKEQGMQISLQESKTLETIIVSATEETNPQVYQATPTEQVQKPTPQSQQNQKPTRHSTRTRGHEAYDHGKSQEQIIMDYCEAVKQEVDSGKRDCNQIVKTSITPLITICSGGSCQEEVAGENYRQPLIRPGIYRTSARMVADEIRDRCSGRESPQLNQLAQAVSGANLLGDNPTNILFDAVPSTSAVEPGQLKQQSEGVYDSATSFSEPKPVHPVQSSFSTEFEEKSQFQNGMEEFVSRYLTEDLINDAYQQALKENPYMAQHGKMTITFNFNEDGTVSVNSSDFGQVDDHVLRKLRLVLPASSGIVTSGTTEVSFITNF